MSGPAEPSGASSGASPAASSDPEQLAVSRRKPLVGLSLAALGIVYGDIGTSPLYAIRECFHGDYGIDASRANVLGVLSLVFWALTIVVTVKYLTFVLRADNHGEGGAIALTALLLERGARVRGHALLLALGLFASSLLYGDGMITPAISVLSAVEGIGAIAAGFDAYVIPVTLAILTGLFLLQRHGTGRVGALFGPITLVWFAVLALLGVRGLVRHPEVLAALDPSRGASFLAHNGAHGFLVLGAVFLVVTGSEALYADLGHFGRGPIRAAWFAVVLPSLLLNYFGQGALLLADPRAAENPFYALAPAWALIPLVVLATVATIIASQAVISGAFSLTRQAIQLGYCPRMQVLHTSPEHAGQIYIPAVNWILMLATLALVVGFRTSSKLAAAYGVAVTTTMTVTTLLFHVVARRRWGWSRARTLPLTGLFLLVNLAFFSANVSKVLHGAWFPLAIGGVAYFLLSTWRRGRELLTERLTASSLRFEDFVTTTVLDPEPVRRTPGRAVFLTSDPERVPPALIHNLKHNQVLHEQVALLTLETADVPRVDRDDKVTVEDQGNGFFRIEARFGFAEAPNVPYVLALARERGLDFPLEDTSFFLGREHLRPARHPGMHAWRERVFAFLLRNARGATSYYAIPPDQVIEVGIQVQL